MKSQLTQFMPDRKILDALRFYCALVDQNQYEFVAGKWTIPAGYEANQDFVELILDELDNKQITVLAHHLTDDLVEFAGFCPRDLLTY